MFAIVQFDIVTVNFFVRYLIVLFYKRPIKLSVSTTLKKNIVHVYFEVLSHNKKCP